MSPGVDRKLVSEHVLGLDHLGTRDSTRSDDKESGLDVLRGKEVEQARSVGGRSIVCRVPEDEYQRGMASVERLKSSAPKERPKSALVGQNEMSVARVLEANAVSHPTWLQR